MHTVDTARGRQFESLCGYDRRSDFGTAQCDLVANEARQQGGFARDELGEPAGVGRRQFNAGARRVNEMHQRRRTTDSAKFRPPLRPCRVGNVAGNETRLTEAQVVRSRHLNWCVQKVGFGLAGIRIDREVVGCSIGAPHTATVGARAVKPAENGPSFATPPRRRLGRMDVVAALTTGVVTLVVVGGGLVAFGFVVLFRRRGDRGIRGSIPSGIESLHHRAGTLLVRLDDAVRDADDEIGYAIAQFGATKARPYGDALAAARTRLTEAFRLRQALDDAVPDSPRQQREWTLQIIALCEQAESELAKQNAAFSALRALEVNAAGTLADVRSRIAASTARLVASRATLAEVRLTYSAPLSAAVAENPDAAEKLLGEASRAADTAAMSISPTGVNAVSPRLQDAAQAANHADQLLDAVDRTARDLAAASEALIALRTRTATDLTEATAQVTVAPDADTGAAIVDAIAAVEQARSAPTDDPVAALDRLGEAVAGLDLALASARNQAQRLEHARTAYLGTVVSARNQISTAREFISRQGAGVDARTRVAEAERQFAAAEASTDPVEALDTIRRAITLARDADALARYDRMGTR